MTLFRAGKRWLGNYRSIRCTREFDFVKYSRPQLFWSLVVSLSMGLAPAPVSRAQDDAGSLLADVAKSAATSTSQGTTPKKAVRGDTYVKAPEALTPVLAGKTPESIVQLGLMEKQQQEIAELAAACTVSVQIGRSQGCGVIITGDGYVLTAAHVAMRTNKDAILTLSDGRRVPAKTLGLNREVDAGLIKISSDTDQGKPWSHASLGTSKDLKTGMWCVAMGHPGGYEHDRGVVARIGRILAVRSGAIVTDCALIGGDSGGPLFNLEGKLIGVHSRIGNDVADNLHVPVDHYDASWNRLVRAEAWGFLPGFRPVLGVSGNAQADVATIASVAPNSAADAAGLQAGDIIERFGDRTIGDFSSLQAAVAETMPGERVDLRVRREGDVFRITVEIGRDPHS